MLAFGLPAVLEDAANYHGSYAKRIPRREFANVTQPLTCDDLWRIREASNERLEIIAGELFASPPSTPMHQLILGHLGNICYRAVDPSGLGVAFPAMLDVRLAHDTVVLPDLMIVLNDRMTIITDWGIDGSPSFLAEIVSDYSGFRDRAYKRDLYAWFEVPEYWIVDPDEQRVTICSDPRDGQYRQERIVSDAAVSATIPNLSVELTALFAPPFSGRREQ